MESTSVPKLTKENSLMLPTEIPEEQKTGGNKQRKRPQLKRSSAMVIGEDEGTQHLEKQISQNEE